ncbi:MAG TPA: IPT/TIG domain-containing protein [Longimicrobium sp.]|jgi:hypothetical protein
MRLHLPGRTRPYGVALVLLAAACSDRPSNPMAVLHPDAPPGTTAQLACTAAVATGIVTCEPLTPEGASFDRRPGTPALDRRTVGGQGTYLRLTSSNVAYATEVFAFDLTVQNLANLAMATDDGTVPNLEGVRVVIPVAPTATSGTGQITVANETGQAVFSGSEPQDYFQYGGSAGTELGVDGILASGEVSSSKRWQFNVPATVNTFTFTLWVSTHMPAGALQTIAPQVTSVSPSPMVPGGTATITGINFDPTAANNVVNIGGTNVVPSAATATSLTVTVPCVLSGNVPVYATRASLRGAAKTAALLGNQRTVGIGQALILTNNAEVACNELTSAGGTARYIVSVFSASTSPSSNSPFQLVPDGEPAVAAAQAAAANVTLPGLYAQVANAAQMRTDERHEELLEKNRIAYEELRSRNASMQNRARRNVVAAAQVEPPVTRTFRVSNINAASICSNFYVVSATRVYYNGKVAIYEDDATPDAFKSSLNATMAANYQKIGNQFNSDMEPIIRNNFGDVLRRDAETDNNGVLVALFTPRINNSFSGVAGFVISCDQFANTDTTTYAVGGPYTGTAGANGASNFGQFFYAYQPVTAGSGYSGNTADNWYRTIRSTFIHETKHVVSMAARTVHSAPLEASWLEEGTARHAEELWMRNAVDNVAWKANTGHGTGANPINTYCDFRPGFPECDANPRRPANIMQRHFSSMYTHMFGTNARILSPFGATSSDTGNYWYAISWSLVRYSIDRYAASDAAFFSALIESSDVGVTNLTNRVGVPIDQLLGGWSLALAADDHPLMAGAASPDIQMPTWNFRSIYAGFNADIPGTYSLAYPLVPTALAFGAFSTPAPITTLRGGGVLWYEFSGTQTAPQLIKLQGSGGSAIPSTLRLAVTRIQ